MKMYEKLEYSMMMDAREIEGLNFVEGKYLLDPNDPKAFNSMEEIELYKKLASKPSAGRIDRGVVKDDYT